MPTAKLTPEYERRLVTKLDNIEKGIEFDNLSNCAPPGHPRWMTEPFLRDFVVTPDQTYLINEMVNDIRRIYTDGRDHIPEADRYPLWNGDSIGFWDGGKLVIHTNSLRSGQYQRTQPEYTEQVETVEIWEKVDDKTLVAHVWVYDPPSLAQPWYSKHTYLKLTNDDKSSAHSLLGLRARTRTTRSFKPTTARRSSAISRSRSRTTRGDELVRAALPAIVDRRARRCAACAPESAAARAARGSAPRQLVPAERAAKVALGLEHATAADLYAALKARANGGAPLSLDDMPDWTGLWQRVGRPFFDPDQPQAC